MEKDAQRLDLYRAHIEWYRKVRPDYEKLAHCLQAALKQAAGALGLHAIVQARPKTIASYAEKILRKQYAAPEQEMTDLCGGRVILHTLGGVAAVCRYVEQHFQVFPEASGDKRDDLAASEFGYLSRHYVVAFKPGGFPTDLVPEHLVDPERKMELQVRTILQHAWADINHELQYKNSFQLPPHWDREFARLAAVLEEADRGFDGIRTGLEDYAASYGASSSAEEMRAEMDNLAVVLEADPRNGDVAQRLAKLAMSFEDWERAIAVLRPFAAAGPAALLRDLGVSLCKRQRHAPADAEFAEGQDLLRRAVATDPTDVDALASLGGTWRTKENAAATAEERAACRRQAHEHYRRAHLVDRANPFALGNYLEYELVEHPGLDVVAYFQSALEAAGRRCHLHAEARVNLPWAYFDLGKFQMFLRHPEEALGYYARGVALSSAPFFLESALGSFTTLAAARERLPGFEWCRSFLQLALTLRFGKGAGAAAAPVPLRARVVILAGYTDRPMSAAHRALLRDALHDYPGSVLSGGTAAGVCAAPGELQAADGARVHVVGYVPGRMPAGVEVDARYGALRRSGGDGFSPLEPLLYWSDVLAAGLKPAAVRLVCVGGGRLSAIECQLALALGVQVGLIDVEGTEVGRALAAHPWAKHTLVQTLPAKAAALREFLGV
jgi:ppGpp synthetase/RelA/SpoT-type nucleotidyltranferase